MTLDHDNPVRKREFCKRSQISLFYCSISFSTCGAFTEGKWQHKGTGSLLQMALPLLVFLLRRTKVGPPRCEHQNPSAMFERFFERFRRFNRLRLSIAIDGVLRNSRGHGSATCQFIWKMTQFSFRSTSVPMGGGGVSISFLFTLCIPNVIKGNHNKAFGKSEGSKCCLSVHICT